MNEALPPSQVSAQRPAGLRPLDDALAEMLVAVNPLADIQSLPLAEADGAVLAQDLIAGLDVPGFDNSQMDGYAVRSGEALAGRVLPVAMRIPAGQFCGPLPLGAAARIFTGAALPQGADAVLMQEDCTALDGERVQINANAKPGQWIRRRAEDIACGRAVLKAGALLGPAQIGLAASIGYATLPVREPLRVALLSTGDELVTPGSIAPAQLQPGAIFNSNRYFLAALLRRWGAQVIDLGLVADTRKATLAAMQQAANAAHLILTTGGVSVGEEDHVKPAVQALGELNLWQISMKPGKPFAFGHVRKSAGSAHFVGLPGNPVSSFVTALLLVRPLVRALRGLPQEALTYIEATASQDGPKADKRREFLRARLEAGPNGKLGLRFFPNQNSSVLTSMDWADVLVDNPSQTQIAAGDAVRCLRISQLMA